MKYLRNGVVMAAVLLATAVMPARAEFFFFENPMMGKKAPDFTLKSLKRDSNNLTEMRDGQPAIIFFWATWCPHCRVQLKELHDQSAELSKKGIQLILVDLNEEAKDVQRFLDKAKMDIDVLIDADGDVADEYGLIGVPTFYFLDKDGVVKAVEHSIPEDYEELIM